LPTQRLTSKPRTLRGRAEGGYLAPDDDKPNHDGENKMNLRTCDCCAKRSKELNRVEVGAQHTEWYVCADCYTNVVPRIPRTTEVPLLSTLFPFGGR